MTEEEKLHNLMTHYKGQLDRARKGDVTYEIARARGALEALTDLVLSSRKSKALMELALSAREWR